MKMHLIGAIAVAGLLAVAPLSVAHAAYDPAAGLSVEQSTALPVTIGEVNALIVQYKDDVTGLQAAIENYVASAGDPLVATKAVIAVLEGAGTDEVKGILSANSGLRTAIGQGLGSAIASLGVTNPDLATLLSAEVSASGDDVLIANVATGSETASIAAAKNSAVVNNDSTPEKPASNF